MDDQGLNKYLEDTYGRTVDGKVLFRLIWSTGVTEFRKSRFIDFSGDLQIRDVIETREVLKYPFAQDRWVLERIKLIDKKAREFGLVSDENYSYEEIYVFQDREGNFLPLNREALEAAMYLFCKFYLQMTPKERADMRMQILANKELQKRNDIAEKLGEGRSPFGFVLE
jgi:hypothetical protein